MPTNPPGLLRAIQQLLDRKAELEAELVQINARLLQAESAVLGTTPATPPPAPGLEYVSRYNAPPRIDGRRAGSMVEYMLEVLRSQPSGMTRRELKEVIAAHPVFGPKLRRNENAFYNATKRLAAPERGEIVVVGEKLYLPEHAPQPGEEPDESPGVVSLFGRGEGK